MQDNTVDVDIETIMPALVRVQMHVPRYGFRVDWHWIESVGQDSTRPIEWVGVTVGTTYKSEGDSPGAGSSKSGLKDDIAVFGPLSKSPENFGLDRCQRHLGRDGSKGVTEVEGVVGIEAPAMDNVGVLGQRPRRTDHARTGHQTGIGTTVHEGIVCREDVGNLVQQCQELEIPRQARNYGVIFQ